MPKISLISFFMDLIHVLQFDATCSIFSFCIMLLTWGSAYIKAFGLFAIAAFAIV